MPTARLPDRLFSNEGIPSRVVNQDVRRAIRRWLLGGIPAYLLDSAFLTQFRPAATDLIPIQGIKTWLSTTSRSVITTMNTVQTGSEFHLSREEIMKTVGAIPPLPPSVVQLNNLFADPCYEFDDVVRAVQLDPPLTGRLLHLANCANRGTRSAGSMNEAVFRLGSGIVKSVAMAECVRPAVDLDLSAFQMTPTSYWMHSVTVVCFAEELATQGVGEFGTDFSVAALLHDFGKIVLAAHLTPEHCYFLHQQDQGRSASGLERAILNVDHAEVSAAVAQGWALPETLVRSIQHHHRPELFDHPLCHGLNIANQLAWQLEGKEDDLRYESISWNLSTEALGLTPEKLEIVLQRGSARLQHSLEAYA